MPMHDQELSLLYLKEHSIQNFHQMQPQQFYVTSQDFAVKKMSVMCCY